MHPSLPEIHIPSGLPRPDATALAHGRKVQDHLVRAIGAAGGILPFQQWMQAALYAPALGYYSAGSTKLDAAGDFTTAPETTPLFGQTLARQVAEVLRVSGCAQVLEFGAGSGSLANSLLAALHALGITAQYHILEVSADLRARQQARLAAWGAQVRWLDMPPQGFCGCVLANEVLDAMPVILFRFDASGQAHELGVALAPDPSDPPQDGAMPFRWASHPLAAEAARLVADRLPAWPGYQSELNLRAEAWVRDMGRWLHKGVALLIDYGFPRAEYYHPQRHQGTLMCHFRHHAHDQPLILPGLQDITAHVDFTAMADAALDGGLDVLGYTSQARFLLNLGLTDLLPAAGPQAAPDAAARARQLAALNTLLSEAEMGELFKVLAIGRGVAPPLAGFVRGDRRDRL
ncbi:class I SAM-dependent methyltransferase [Castellaniella sp.]|uniref:class I SAM-dependent methyltransferase n=1 Tax=Castellaniella sp. TaxID=1955812 RepID=UPI00356045AC